jgi:secretion/DNA translocation related TadE-like protein
MIDFESHRLLRRFLHSRRSTANSTGWLRVWYKPALCVMNKPMAVLSQYRLCRTSRFWSGNCISSAPGKDMFDNAGPKRLHFSRFSYSAFCKDVPSNVGGGCDEGSGTINGVMLITVAAVLISAIAAGGNVLLCISQARSAADQAAIAGAYSASDGDFDPCLKSRITASLNDASVVSCTVVDEDVTVKAEVKTAVPFVPAVSRMARAGPVECH